MTWRALTIALLTSACLFPASAQAATPIVESEALQLDFGGFLSAATGIQHRFYDIPTLPNTTGLSANLLRFEWRAHLGDRVSVDIHNRFFSRIGSNTVSNIGLGSTVPPARTIDLQSPLVDEPGLTLEHDLDRAAIAINTPAGDLTLGRQAVTWGVAALFPVSDFWTQFSPFELDTSQKRGVDALRFFAYPTDTLELDVIVVDRGDLDLLSGGAQLTWAAPTADYHMALARSYDTAWYTAGAAFDLSWGRLYGEGGLGLDTEQSEFAASATAGINLLRPTYTLSFEYHHNGFGDAGQQAQTRMQRGEIYLMNHHYLGLAAAYTPREFIVFSLATLAALQDVSFLFAPSLDYEIAPDVHARLMGYFGAGERPDFAVSTQIPTEFGLYGESYLLELSAFF